MPESGHEAEEVKEVIWQYTGWAVILLVCIGAGVFIGWSLWGDAATLARDLNEQSEMVNTLKNERETLKSQLALATRDKTACERRLAEAAEAPAAEAPAAEAPAAEVPTVEAPAGSPPGEAPAMP